jgi:hypothetical protein
VRFAGFFLVTVVVLVGFLLGLVDLTREADGALYMSIELKVSVLIGAR